MFRREPLHEANRVIAFLVLVSFVSFLFPLPMMATPISSAGALEDAIVADGHPPLKSVSGEATPEGGCLIELDGVSLQVPPGAVDKPLWITIIALPGTSALADGMSNATSGAPGYRFEPHGTRFRKPVRVSMPFERSLLDSETALSNLFTYYFNDEELRWERLDRICVDRERALTVSATTHFTDMINATLKLPEGPSPIGFDVNSIKNLEAADPSSGVPKVEGLEGGPFGAASFRIPLRLPAGRGGASPRLALSYSSESANSWMGRGFDIGVPRISIDTKFGLPVYDGADTYVLAGEELVPAGSAPGGGLLFRPLKEQGFQRIVWHRDGGEDYWAVTDKNGHTREYGRGEGWIGPDRGDRSRTYVWYLTGEIDPFGNTVSYGYAYDAENACTYLSSIRYSGFRGGSGTEEGAYRVSFTLEEGAREDRRIDSRGGFASKLARRLDRVGVYYGDQLIRYYQPAYEYNEFGQSVLKTWAEHDAAGNPFYSYSFDYYALGGHRNGSGEVDGYDGFEVEQDWAMPASAPVTEISKSDSFSIGGSVNVGVYVFFPVEASFGIFGGLNGLWSTGRSALLDVNGDGLPDFSTWANSAFSTYLNTGSGFGGLFGVSGVTDGFSKESQTTVSVGGTAGAFGFSGSLSYQQTWAGTDLAFMDVNGDGFIDLLTKEGTQFGLNNGVGLSGQMAFMQTPWAMTGSAPAGLPDPKAAEYEKLYYKQEPVRAWRSYRSGTVEVAQSAQLVSGSAGGAGDSVGLSTYAGSGTIPIASMGLSSANPAAALPPLALQVDRDDPLYFHMDMGNAERGCDTEWNVRIRYTSVKLLEGMRDAADVWAPAQMEVAGMDMRLAPIYQLENGGAGLVFVLKADWESTALQNGSVYQALVEDGFFIPNRLNEADMGLLLAACSGGGERAALCSGFRYVSETHMFYRTGALGDAVMRQRVSGAFPGAAKKLQVAGCLWYDGSIVLPRKKGQERELERWTPGSTVPSRLLSDAQSAEIGETVMGAGILLDRLWSAEGGLMESWWLRRDEDGGWHVYARDAGGERDLLPQGLAVSDLGETLMVRFTDRLVQRVFILSGRSRVIERMLEETYSGPLGQAILGSEVFSTDGYSRLPAAFLDPVLAGLTSGQRAVVNACYEKLGAEYALKSGVTDGQLQAALVLIEPEADRDDGIFDAAADLENRFILLSQTEYASFSADHPEAGACFDSFTAGAATCYLQKRELAEDERAVLRAAMSVFRRDVELFPYYDASDGTRVLKGGLDDEALMRVAAAATAADLYVWESSTRGIVYNSGTSFPVIQTSLPEGALEETDAPRGSLPETPVGAPAGEVELPVFDAGARTFLMKRYVHVFDSGADYMAQNLVQTSIAYPQCANESTMLQGGVQGWYYGVWTGYYPWSAVNLDKQPPAAEEGKGANPPYFIPPEPNQTAGSGSPPIIEKTGMGAGTVVEPDAWVGRVSEFRDGSADSEGRPTTAVYDFAAFIHKDTLHPERMGGEAYYRIPRSGSGDPGSLPFINASESYALDAGAGFQGMNLSSNVGSSWQKKALMDLNGDRYPDLIDYTPFTDGHFSVRPGTGSGFANSLTYAGPAGQVSQTDSNIYGLGASGSCGLPNITAQHTFRVQGLGDTVITATLNVAAENITGQANATIGSSRQTMGFYDINGDGLPDQVFRTGTEGFRAALNLGTGGFGALQEWGNGIQTPSNLFEGLLVDIPGLSTQPSGISHTGTGSFGASAGYKLSIAGTGVSLGIGGGFAGTLNQTFSSLEDVNGDGLPDQVVKLKDEPFFRVKFNLGDHFSDSEVRIYRPEWVNFDPGAMRAAVERDLTTIALNMNGVELPQGNTGLPEYKALPSDNENKFQSASDPLRVDDMLDYSTGVSFKLSGTASYGMSFGFVALIITGGLDGSWASTQASIKFTDVNGDGLPDHVMKLPNESFMRIKANAMGKAGLLSAVHLPQGGRYGLEYERVGNTVDMPQSRWVLSKVTRDAGATLPADRGVGSYEVSYEYRNGYYSRTDREFWGFSEVRTSLADGSRQAVYYRNREYYTRGMEWKRETTGSAANGPAALLAMSLTDVEIEPLGYYDEKGRQGMFPRVSAETKRLYDASSGEYTESRTRYGYTDAYGNIEDVWEDGDTTVSGDELSAHIEYAELPGYFRQHPESITVQDASGALLRKREGQYGSHGELAGLTQFESPAVGRTWIIDYDGYGNLQSIRDPRGAMTAWEYDAELHSFIVSSTISNPLLGGPSYGSSAAWDYRFGVETERVDMNGEAMSFSYDSQGRLVEVRSPYDTGSLPAVSYQYFISDAPWYTVTKNKVSHDAADYQTLSTVISADGLGRILQTAKQGEVRREGSALAGWNLSGAVAYDAKGRTVAEGQSAFMEGPGLPGLAVMKLPTLKTYDYLDRATSITLPDGAESLMSYFIHDGKQVERAIDPKGNISETVRDVRGNAMGVSRLDASGTLLTGASYEYDGLGQVLTVLDLRGNAVRSAYDLMGRRIRLESPDAGVVEYAFDAAGNMARKTDSVLRSRGQSIQYMYDALNRLVKIDYPRSPDVLTTYGSPGAPYGGAGRIISTEDESGTIRYRYGRLGEITREERTINRLTPLAPDETAVLSYESDYLGRIESITYPDGETVNYGYDYGGQVKSVTGTHYGITTQYVQDIGYDEYGQRVYIKYGNGIETSYTYDENRRWLDTINTRTGWNEVYQAMSYSFDEVGNVLGVTNTASTYQTSYSYGYDALYQLTHAEGQISAQKYGMPDYTSRYTQDFGFDTIGNLTSKISTLTTTPSKTIGASLDYELDYAYYPGKAHQAERVGDLWYRYDANGNMTEERQGGHSMTPSDEADLSLVGDVRVANRGFGLSTGEPSDSHVYERTFTWDEENRLKRSTDAAATVDYRYGSDGERAVKYSSSGETLYFDSLWQMTTDYPNLRQSKHVYVGEARIATRCNIKGYTDAGYETLNTYYYHPDHLGSAQLVTDYEGQKYEHMEYTPYGELWVEEVSEPVSKTPFRFTGKEMDEETGLYYYGARYMNPRTSLWISVDPAMDGMNWYGYCAWNPVKYTDPTGLATDYAEKAAMEAMKADNACTAALEAARKGYDSDDEYITTSTTFSDSAQAIVKRTITKTTWENGTVLTCESVEFISPELDPRISERAAGTDMINLRNRMIEPKSGAYRHPRRGGPHPGIDILNIYYSPMEWQPIYAENDGIVKQIYGPAGDPGGMVIDIQTNKNAIVPNKRELYIHMNPIVSVGNSVVRGQLIGYVSDVSRPHLHYQIGIRETKNPSAYYSNM